MAKKLKKKLNGIEYCLYKLNETNGLIYVVCEDQMTELESIMYRLSITMYWEKLQALYTKLYIYYRQEKADKNLWYLFNTLKTSILNFPETFKHIKSLYHEAMRSKTPYLSLFYIYKQQLEYQYRLFADPNYRYYTSIVNSRKEAEAQKELQIQLMNERIFDCRGFLYDSYRTNHPVRHYFYYRYITLIRWLEENTFSKFIIFISVAIGLQLCLGKILLTYFEYKLAYSEDKLSRLKTLIGNNVGEIKIGLANKQLRDLYSSTNTPLYIMDPNIHYSRKDFQLIKPIIKSLNTLNYRKYGKY